MISSTAGTRARGWLRRSAIQGLGVLAFFELGSVTARLRAGVSSALGASFLFSVTSEGPSMGATSLSVVSLAGSAAGSLDGAAVLSTMFSSASSRDDGVGVPVLVGIMVLYIMVCYTL